MSFSKKKVGFITLISFVVLTILVYWFGFYKKYDSWQIHKDADVILVLDKKRIARTFIWQYLNTPSEWRFWPEKDKDTWKWEESGLKIQDYLCLFTLPKTENHWYLATEIINEKDFFNTIQEFQLQEDHNEEWTFYHSDSIHLSVVRHNDKILISNQKKTENLKIVALEVFKNQESFTNEEFKEITKELKHGTIWIKQNQWLTENWISSLQINEFSISLKGKNSFNTELFPNTNLNFYENNNVLNASLPLTNKIIENLDEIHKKKIENWTGFSLDSLALFSPNQLNFNISNINKKEIKTITYEFDDDFNEVETEIIDTVYEPNLALKLSLKKPQNFYRYLKKNQLIDSAEVFVQIPFAKALTKLNEQNLLFSSQDYHFNENENIKTNDLLKIRLNLSKTDSLIFENLPLPNRWNPSLNQLESVNINLTKEQFLFDIHTKQTKPILISLSD